MLGLHVTSDLRNYFEIPQLFSTMDLDLDLVLQRNSRELFFVSLFYSVAVSAVFCLFHSFTFNGNFEALHNRFLLLLHF